MSEAVAPSGLGSGSRVARVLSDERLARRAVQGDQRAFAAIFDRYHQSLYRYCLAIVGDSHDAQDALQNTMVKVLGALPGEERHIKLKPWLYRIAHNESIELLRRRRDTRQLDPELATVGAGLAEEAASRERLRRLIADLDQLPGRQRGALVMRELAGLDFDEIGTALETSPAVARQTLYEARLGLRQMDEGREMSCETVTKALSDGDGRIARRRDIHAHLRACPSCRSFREEIEHRQRDLAALSPLPAVAAAGLLQGLVGGHGATGGLATALGGGAAQSLGASAAIKGAATVAVVAAIGVGTADRSGLIDVGLPGGDGSQATRKAPSAAETGSGGAQPAVPSSAAAIDATAGSAAGQKGGGHVGASQAADPGAGKVVTSDGAKTTAEAAPGPTAHAHGKGHEGQLLDASTHGQETAASHKTTNHGHSGAQSHPAHPSKPAHPAHQPKPTHPAPPSIPKVEKKSAPPPSSPTAPESHAHENAAAQATGNEEGSSPEPEAGKKP